MLDDPQLIAQVRAMATDDFWIFTAILIAIALIGALAAFFMLKRSRMIEDMQTSRIRSAAQGPVELEGIARLLPGEPIIAPLSRRECAWWKYSIEEKERNHSSGRNSSHWRTIDSGTSDEMFQLVDDTGDCVVDPEGAKVIPNCKITWYGNHHRPSGAPDKSQWISFGRYRYREERIETGSPLYALGWFHTEGGIAHDFDEKAEVRELLAQWKQDAALMSQFDTDGDGQVDVDEWEAARQKAIAQVRATQVERATDPDIHVLCRPPRRLGFILSTVPQDSLIRRARIGAAAGLAGFILGGGASVWMLTARGLL